METLLMKGKPVADAYRETVSAKITAAKEKGIKVTLAIIVVGDDPASHVYKDRCRCRYHYEQRRGLFKP